MALDYTQIGATGGLVTVAIALAEVVKHLIVRNGEKEDKEETNGYYSVPRIAERQRQHGKRIDGHSERLNALARKTAALEFWATSKGYDGE